MKISLFYFGLLSAASLIFLSSCQQRTVEFSSSRTETKADLSRLLPPPKAICCIEGENSCFLGFEFSPNYRDSKHPNGGYLVKRISGDCDCQYENGEWNVMTTGNIEIYSGIIENLRSELCRALSVHPADNPLSQSSVHGEISEGEQWETWLSKVLDDLQQMTNPPGTDRIGVVNIPEEWNISISSILADERLKIKFSNQAQAELLRQVRIFPNGSKTSLIQVLADGSMTFDVDMKSLSDGFYQVKLDFWPGFQLVETVGKTTKRS